MGGNEITRRTFIKRTGGATVATLVAWNLSSQQLQAEENSAPSSGWWMKCHLPEPDAGKQTKTFGLRANGTLDPDAVGWKKIKGPFDTEETWYRCFVEGVMVVTPTTEPSFGYNEKKCTFVCKGRWCMKPCHYEGEIVDPPDDESSNAEGWDGWTEWEVITREAVQQCDSSSGNMTNQQSANDAEQPEDVMDSGLLIKTEMTTNPDPDDPGVETKMELVHPHTNRSGGVIEGFVQFEKAKH